VATDGEGEAWRCSTPDALAAAAAAAEAACEAPEEARERRPRVLVSRGLLPVFPAAPLVLRRLIPTSTALAAQRDSASTQWRDRRGGDGLAGPSLLVCLSAE